MPTAPVISVRGVNHHFGIGPLRRQILHDISAEIFPGEIVILAGPSGSGKTTLLTLIGALRSVQEGSVRVLGRELYGADTDTQLATRRQIGFIFQGHNLLPTLTVVENVRTALAMDNRLPGAEGMARCLEMLNAVGLADAAHRRPHQLSGGQKQRVAIARALAGQPSIVLADEPTASLDRQTGREVVELLHRLARRQGCAIVLVTHDHRILDVADRVLSLEDGRLGSFAQGVMANATHLLSTLTRLNQQGKLPQHLEEMTDGQFAQVLERSSVEAEQFLHAIEMSNHAAVEATLDKLLEALTRKISVLLQADHATLYFVDQENALLWSKYAVHGGKPLAIRVPITTGIAGRVATTGEPLNIADAQECPFFNPEIDRRTGYRTRSVLCLPVRNREHEVFAVVQALNKNDGKTFGADDERQFRDFAAAMAPMLETYRRLQAELEQKRAL